ncbi:MAG: hypothetical protein ACJ780_21730 [Solirubrobacteraceae bacterium]
MVTPAGGCDPVWGIVGIALGAINTLIFSLQVDTVDYGDWKTGWERRRML